MTSTVRFEAEDRVAVITMTRPECRNAIDRTMSESLADAFRRFDADEGYDVAVLTGEGPSFCAGADLKAIADGKPNRVEAEGDGPLGPTRMMLGKPVIAAIEGHAVAGGLELAIWCDLRVAARDAILGVLCRRFGVPLIDGGTVRLPRLIGHSRALDLILTGRQIVAEEAFLIGLVNRLAKPGEALSSAIELAESIAAHPQTCLRTDRLSTYEQWEQPSLEAALLNELRRGRTALRDPKLAGAVREFLCDD